MKLRKWLSIFLLTCLLLTFALPAAATGDDTAAPEEQNEEVITEPEKTETSKKRTVEECFQGAFPLTACRL